MKLKTTGKFILLTALVLTTALLSGCGNAIPDMTDEQQALVCQYAADLLLDYDANHVENILTDEEVAKERAKLEDYAAVKQAAREQKEQAAASKEAESSEEDKDTAEASESSEPVTPVYADIAEFFGLQGLSIEFADYEICDSYPADATDNDWQGVCRAGSGNKLVAFEFDLINNSGADFYLDMASVDASFSFYIDNRITKSALTTLLTNDFIMYRGTIPYENGDRAVILIEMSAEDAESISNVVLKIKYNGNTMETTLL